MRAWVSACVATSLILGLVCLSEVRASSASPAWVTNTLRSQLNLQVQLPINELWLPGVSNVFLSDDLYLYNTEGGSFEALLEAGVRLFKISSVQQHSVQEPYFYMCPPMFERLAKEEDCQSGISHGGLDSICMRFEFPNRCPLLHSRRFVDAFLRPLRAFLANTENSNDMVIVWVDLELEPNGYEHFVENVRGALGQLVFDQKTFKSFGLKFPSLKEARNMNKRVLLVEGKNGPGAEKTEFISADQFRKRVLPEQLVRPFKDVQGYPQCDRVNGGAVTDGTLLVYGDSWEVQRDFSSLLYNGPEEVGSMSRSDVESLIDCGFIALPDNLPASDVAAFAWSWASGEPQEQTKGDGKVRCALATPSGWHPRSCDEKHRHACQDSKGALSLTSHRSVWTPTSCVGAGSSFALPINPRSNKKLQKLIEDAGEEGVWIGLSNNDVLGKWTSKTDIPVNHGPTDYQTKIVHNLFGTNVVLYAIATLLAFAVLAVAMVLYLYRKKQIEAIKYKRMTAGTHELRTMGTSVDIDDS